jgi:hypothetical protein
MALGGNFFEGLLCHFSQLGVARFSLFLRVNRARMAKARCAISVTTVPSEVRSDLEPPHQATATNWRWLPLVDLAYGSFAHTTVTNGRWVRSVRIGCCFSRSALVDRPDVA